MKIRYILIPIIFVFFMWASYDSTMRSKTPEGYLNKNTWVAKMMCRDEIKKTLKAPESSVFSSEEVWFTWEKWKEAFVQWVVSAQNSFWAQLSSQYFCTFSWTGSSYVLIDSKVNQKW